LYKYIHLKILWKWNDHAFSNECVLSYRVSDTNHKEMHIDKSNTDFHHCWD
jgi:hypothetical protein